MDLRPPKTCPLVIILGLVALLAAACSSGPGGQPTREGRPDQPSALNLIRQQKKVIAGWGPYAPYAFKDTATGKVNGYYIELFDRVASEAKVDVEWVETTWGTMIADLNAGKFQVMAAPTFRTIPRAMEVAFTRPIDYFGYSAIVRVGESRFKKIADFNRPDVTIAVTQGEVGHEFAKQHLPKAKLVVHKTGDIALALVDVIQQKADAGICDAWTAKQFTKEHTTKVTDLFAAHPFNVVGAGWFVRPGDEAFLRFLNTSIDWLETSGTIEQLAHNYELGSFTATTYPAKDAPAH